MLRVHGESMVDAHILDGDLVVVRKQPNCENGDIVVARIDGDEATLKRFYRLKDRIRLQPANAAMRPIFRKHVEIIGVVVGVVRQV